MATTYLDITNEVLRELNEVPLTAANFTNATGIQKFVKDSINKAIFDIANEEPQLPFFSAGASGETDPFYGNVTVATVAGTFDTDSIYGTVFDLPEEALDFLVADVILKLLTKPSSTLSEVVFQYMRSSWKESKKDLEDWISTRVANRVGVEAMEII